MRNALLLGTAAFALLTTSPGLAQSAPADTADRDIIVTAQKREERLRDVPLAVSAISGTALQSQQITTATDLRLISPSLNFTPSANARGEGFAIRGVGTAIFSDTVEQSVGVVVDGVVLGRSGQATGDLLDLERVEVLRGPQAAPVVVVGQDHLHRIQAHGLGDMAKSDGAHIGGQRHPGEFGHLTHFLQAVDRVFQVLQQTIGC